MRIFWGFSGLALAFSLCHPAFPDEHPLITNHLGMEFIQIPAGEFMMGTADLEEALFELPQADRSKIDDELPIHRVEFPDPFYLGRTELTQGQWLEVMGTRPGPEGHWQRKDWSSLPVVGVSWHRVQDFIDKLNARDTHFLYRLPTEAEWEYAARAGSGGLRPFAAEQLADYAWYIENSGDVPHPVTTRKPNPWGIYDMFGNAWEWVQDWYAPDTYAKSAPLAPTGPDGGGLKVRRGGSYHCPLHLVRSAYRAADKPLQRYSVLGFRLVATHR